MNALRTIVVGSTILGMGTVAAASPTNRFEFEPGSNGLPMHIDGIDETEPPATPATPPPAPAPAHDVADLAKKLQNPVADLISVPFQFNWDEGFGPKDAGRMTLNIQPVIPFSITEDWNLIIRTILPVIYQGSPVNGVSSEWGLGDTTQTFFFSPKKELGGWLIGVGPAFLWPTATEDNALFGSGKWGAGPSFVVLRQHDGWTYGILANQIWSYAGDNDRPDVSSMFLQPFVAYTWPTATTLSLNTETTYDWHGDEWSVPINLDLAQLLKIGHMPVQVQIGGRYWAETPSGGPEWGVRLTITLLFPR